MNWTDATFLIVGVSALVGFGVCSLAIWAIWDDKKSLKRGMRDLR